MIEDSGQFFLMLIFFLIISSDFFCWVVWEVYYCYLLEDEKFSCIDCWI